MPAHIVHFSNCRRHCCKTAEYVRRAISSRGASSPRFESWRALYEIFQISRERLNSIPKNQRCVARLLRRPGWVCSRELADLSQDAISNSQRSICPGYRVPLKTRGNSKPERVTGCTRSLKNNKLNYLDGWKLPFLGPVPSLSHSYLVQLYRRVFSIAFFLFVLRFVFRSTRDLASLPSLFVHHRSRKTNRTPPDIDNRLRYETNGARRFVIRLAGSESLCSLFPVGQQKGQTGSPNIFFEASPRFFQSLPPPFSLLSPLNTFVLAPPIISRLFHQLEIGRVDCFLLDSNGLSLHVSLIRSYISISCPPLSDTPTFRSGSPEPLESLLDRGCLHCSKQCYFNSQLNPN